MGPLASAQIHRSLVGAVSRLADVEFDDQHPDVVHASFPRGLYDVSPWILQVSSVGRVVGRLAGRRSSHVGRVVGRSAGRRSSHGRRKRRNRRNASPVAGHRASGAGRQGLVARGAGGGLTNLQRSAP
jgi:hypothetical protein